MIFVFYILLLFLCYLSVVDYYFHEFPLVYVVVWYPIIFILDMMMGATLFDAISGFLILFLSMYLMQLFSKEMIYGGLDIVCAPLFTIWFGIGALWYSLLFILVYFICHFKVVTKFLKSGNDESLGRPLIPIMYFTFLISLCLISNTAV